ncbi:hypothetical protein [Neptuniibacter marinus]|uniref:hypothetical protein n=1 Tax=Neptuniibacter marinus TaxID=1806670 RepID=UPI0012E83035|nr:hypothetical protein [Neptuniibacter marinus]
MEFFLMLLIPLGFIGIFLAAPFWISQATKVEHDEVQTESKKYMRVKREKSSYKQSEKKNALANTSTVFQVVSY